MARANSFSLQKTWLILLAVFVATMPLDEPGHNIYSEGNTLSACKLILHSSRRTDLNKIFKYLTLEERRIYLKHQLPLMLTCDHYYITILCHKIAIENISTQSTGSLHD
jgi:hypothetical protein